MLRLTLPAPSQSLCNNRPRYPGGPHIIRILQYLAPGAATSPQTDGVTRGQLVVTIDEAIAKRVRQKCAGGDIRASLRLLSTFDSVAQPTQEVADCLKAKHLPAIQNEELRQQPDADPHLLQMSEKNILKAVHDFPPGSAIGLDDVRPMHFRQLLAQNTPEAGSKHLEALTKHCNAALSGTIPAGAPGRPSLSLASLPSRKRWRLAVGTI